LVDTGDTAWVLGSAALVLFMTPGLALFYGGMVRGKSVLGMMMLNVTAIAVVTVTWSVVGYSLAFAPDAGGGVVGGLKHVFMSDPATQPAGFELTVPPLSFFAFQLMFAIITTALLTGAGADRLKFGGFVLFSAVWSIVVYAPLAHWAFSPTGWLADRGVLDFAGGMVVEINSGAAALALAIVLGRRKGWPREPMAPHSLPLALVGAGILWFGWFGFNAGSALSAGELAAQALTNTQLAACGGLLAWIAMERLVSGRPTTLGAASGAVAGLVGITPAAGFDTAMPALLVGALAGAAAMLACRAKFRLGYDDSLDVVGIHGVSGVVGMLFIGLFADKAINGAIRYDGLFNGGGLHQLGLQALGVGAAAVSSFVATYVVAVVVTRIIPLRVDEATEVAGLDLVVHAEVAYDFGSVRSSGRVD
jgi:Amt family ammonium transporter